jgi:LPXTG-motif cell wall-anchored protein
MKKTLALLGATALGIIGAGATAVPAQAAAPALAACDDVSDHFVAQPNAEWYADCVPQFGAGKVEFSIDTEDAPEGFLPLTDASVTATTDLDVEAANDYDLAEEGFVKGAFIKLDSNDDIVDDIDDDIDDDDDDDAPSTEQSYYATLAAPITGVRGLSVSDLPEQCDDEYDAAYVVTYGAVTTSFVQTVAGEEVRYDITATPAPKTIAFNVTEGEFSGALDYSAPFCVTDGTRTAAFTGSERPPLPSFIASGQIERNGDVTISPFVEAYDSETGGTTNADLGTFARYVAPVVEEPVTQPAAADDSAELAETGADASPALIGAGGLLVAGLAALVFRGRRRENATR